MFFFLFFGIVVSLLLITWAVKEHNPQMAFSALMFIVSVFLLNYMVFPMAFKGMAYDPTDKIPNCPSAGLKHYEYGEGFFSNETRVIEKFHNQNWTNIQTDNRPSGGIFGGHDTFITGDCFV